MNLINVFKAAKPFIRKHEAEILMSFGIGGFILSTSWAIKSTVTATKRLSKKKKELKKNSLTFAETFKEVWALYLPVVILTGASVTSVIMGNKVATRKTAALAAAYAISETALQEYIEQTRETVGEKKATEIKEKISAQKVSETYTGNNVFLTGDGECLFLEPISGRYFKSNWNKILKAANELNAKAMSNMNGVTTLSDWFEELGLSRTSISEDIGWSLENGSNGIISIDVISSMTPDNVPCGSINYNTLPKAY